MSKANEKTSQVHQKTHQSEAEAESEQRKAEEAALSRSEGRNGPDVGRPRRREWSKRVAALASGVAQIKAKLTLQKQAAELLAKADLL